MANDDFTAMEVDYRQQLNSQEFLEGLYAVIYLADTLAHQQKSDAARQAVREWIAKYAGSSRLNELTAIVDRMVDYVCGDVGRFRQVDEAAKSKGQSRSQFYLSLAAGEPDSAVEIAEGDKLTDDWAERLAISLAYSLAGNHQAARLRPQRCS